MEVVDRKKVEHARRRDETNGERERGSGIEGLAGSRKRQRPESRAQGRRAANRSRRPTRLAQLGAQLWA